VSDIIQSMVAKVEVSAKSTIPMGATPRRRALMRSSPVSSCFCDWVEKNVASALQAMK
jgi:hypothetical protein